LGSEPRRRGIPHPASAIPRGRCGSRRRSNKMIRAAVLAAMLAWAAAGQPAARKSVLILLPDPPGRPASTKVLEGAQAAILKADPSVAVAANYIAQRRPNTPAFAEAQRAWYRSRYGDQKFDAIVVFGLQALEALEEFRRELWPDVPVVFCGLDPSGVGGLPAGAN